MEQTVASARQHLKWDFHQKIIIDDSLSAEYRDWLTSEYTDFELHLNATTEKRGFGGAIRAGWASVSNCDYVFHLEDDFIFNEDINIDDMITILEENPSLAQVALKRQPWNDEEHAAGGFMEQNLDAYEQMESVRISWVKQSLFFTTNPSLYSTKLLEIGWPDVPRSEGIFSIEYLLPRGYEFGFLGRKEDPPKVTHIGTNRVGVGY